MRRLSHIIFDAYIVSNLHLCVSITALTCLSLSQLSLPWDKKLLSLVFCGTLVVYQLVKWSTFFSRKSYIFFRVFLLICCAIGSAILFFHITFSSQILLFLLCLLCIPYAVPILPQRRSLRHFALLKIGVVALCWSGVSVLFPVLFFGVGVSFSVALLFLQHFLWVLLLILPFEIRDIHIDHTSLGTVAQRWGVPRTKRKGYFLSLLLILCSLLRGFHYFFYILMTLLSTLFLYFSEEKRSRLYCEFFVESLPQVGLFLFLLIKYFHL